MRIGAPTEIKSDEYRVSLTPAGVRELVSHGHEVVVQAGAGAGSRIEDREYEREGARILAEAERVWAEAELIVKVKEPQREELVYLSEGKTLFTYLHLAADAELALLLCESGAACVAYETVEDDAGGLPLLAPMSEVAGRVAAHAGAGALHAPAGGRGVVLGGVVGVSPATVVVIGGGVVGENAARVAIGMGARVTILDRSLPRLRELAGLFDGRAETVYASSLAVERALAGADLVIGAVLVRGARAPHVVRRADLARMKPGAVLVDVSIDQGGCFETSHPTTHSDPTYEVDGIQHYCVANIPGAVPTTSTFALTNATLPFVLELAREGVERATRPDARLRAGLNVFAGEIVNPAVAEAVGVWEAGRAGSAAPA
jgi:alanine dehydrogenase